MKNFRLRDLLVLVGLVALVFAVFGASVAEAGCGYGFGYYGTYYPTTTYIAKPFTHTYAYPNCYTYPTTYWSPTYYNFGW